MGWRARAWGRIVSLLQRRSSHESPQDIPFMTYENVSPIVQGAHLNGADPASWQAEWLFFYEEVRPSVLQYLNCCMSNNLQFTII
jgi:hypothetical protein